MTVDEFKEEYYKLIIDVRNIINKRECMELKKIGNEKINKELERIQRSLYTIDKILYKEKSKLIKKVNKETLNVVFLEASIDYILH